MAAKHRVTNEQINAAQAFLRTLGADWHDNYLVLAIIAWGTVAIHGKFHNIFNLHPGSWDKHLRTGTYKVDSGHFDPHAGRVMEEFSKYRNMFSAYVALANYLKANSKEFALILSSIRHDRVNDALFAISASSFDPYHYGLGSTNRIYTVYNSLFIVIPGKKQPGPQPPPKPKPLAPIPQVLQPPTLRNTYLSAYTTRDFYRQRHPVEKVSL